jgi:hypothetical protein
MTYYISRLFYIKFKRWEIRQFSTEYFFLWKWNNILTIMRYLNLTYCFTMLDSITLFPLTILLCKEKKLIISSSSYHWFTIRSDCHWSAKFIMYSQSPYLIWFSASNKLVLQILKVYFVLFLLLRLLLRWLLVLFLLLFLLLSYIFLTRIYFHSVDDVIIDHPDIILIIWCYRLSCVSPIRLIILLDWVLIAVNLFLQSLLYLNLLNLFLRNNYLLGWYFFLLLWRNGRRYCNWQLLYELCGYLFWLFLFVCSSVIGLHDQQSIIIYQTNIYYPFT